MRISPVGRRGLVVDLPGPDQVSAVWRALDTDRPAGVEEVVAGARSVLVVTGLAGFDPARLEAWIGAAATAAEAGAGPSTRRGAGVTIPVVYDGPDLGEVAALTGLGAAGVVRHHTAAGHRVGFLGFSPGFAYLVCDDPALAVPRRSTPRPSVPAGSVAVAGGMSAVYPAATPGGWHLVGRTDAVMFDPDRRPPALLAPGDQVRFVAVDRLGGSSGAQPGGTLRAADHGGSDNGGVAGFEVLRPGPLTTVQDAGRRGWAHAGVPRAGALDAGARRRANALVGNRPDAAVLEATVGGPRLRALRDLTVAVAGADAPVTVDGGPVAREAAVHLPAGSVLDIGTARQGLRTYLAVAGGIPARPVLGSASRDTLSGLGPAPLAAGDVVPVGAGGSLARPVGPTVTGGAAPPAPGLPGADLRVGADVGPRWEWVGRAGLDLLAGAGFVVRPESDRVGIRLRGPTLGRARVGEVDSEGMVPGAVQVPPDGQPIVLHRNHAPTGGYPVVAVVRDADLDRLAQARPGCRVRFELSGLS